MCVQTDEQLAFELERVGVYAKYNRERPGFFDRVIDTTNVRDAYKELGVTVMEYLGVGATPTGGTANVGAEGEEVDAVVPESGAKRGTSVRLTG